MSFVKVLVSVPDSEATMNSQYLQLNTAAQQASYNGLENMIAAMVEGSQVAYSKLSAGLLQSTGTVTLSSLVATDTVTVNGVVFTAVASGATGNQFNVGGSDTITATNLSTTINNSVTAKVIHVVTSSASTNVVTITAVQPGLQGNMNTLAISAHGSVSGAFLTGGTDGDEVSTNFGAAS